SNCREAVVKFISVSLLFAPTVNNADEAKLLPKTSFVGVKLTPICSTSRRFPAATIILFFLFNNHLPEIPYLNLSSLNPYAPYPSIRHISLCPKYVLPPPRNLKPSTSLNPTLEKIGP